jgi:hypothetical protein
VEQGLAITAGSLATLRPLLKSVGNYFGWTTKQSRISGRGYGLSATPQRFAPKSSNFSSHRADDVELLTVEGDPSEKQRDHTHVRSIDDTSRYIQRDITIEIHREAMPASQKVQF